MTEEQFHAIELWVTAVARAMVSGEDYHLDMLNQRREEAKALLVQDEIEPEGYADSVGFNT